MYSYDAYVLILVSLWNLDATHEFLESSTDMSPPIFRPIFREAMDPRKGFIRKSGMNRNRFYARLGRTPQVQ